MLTRKLLLTAGRKGRLSTPLPFLATKTQPIVDLVYKEVLTAMGKLIIGLIVAILGIAAVCYGWFWILAGITAIIAGFKARG